MKRLFRIDESEKNRILGMHKTATTKQYLKEQEEEETTDGSQTGQTENEEVVFDCEKINEVLEKPEVKNWIEKITGPAKWTIRRGGEKLAEKDVYKGVIDVIKVIQCKLGLNPDGIFGNDTNSKLKSFQTEKGLKNDGIVGNATWGAMFTEESKSEETPSTNECYMNFGEEGLMLPPYENKAKAARKKDNKTFYFFENGQVIIWEGNSPMGGREQDATYQWQCDGDSVKFMKTFEF